MKWSYGCACRLLVLVVFLAWPSVSGAQADDAASLQQQLEELRQTVAAQAELLEQLQQRLDELTIPRDVTDEQTRQLIDDKLKENREQHEAEKGFFSLKGEWLELGGRIELEYTDYEDEDDAALPDDIHEPNGGFQFDEVELYVKPVLAEWFEGYLALEWDATDDGVKLDQCQAIFHWDEVPTKPRVRLGLMSVPYSFSRRTERYPLIFTAVARDEEIVADYQGEYTFEELGGFTPYWGVTVGNMRRLEDGDTGERPTGLDDIFQLDRGGRNNLERTDQKLLRGRLGLRHDFGDFGAVDLLGYYESGEGDGDDWAYWRNNGAMFSGYDDRELDHWGFRGLYDLPTRLGFEGEVHVQGMYASLQFAEELYVDGWNVLLSHEWKPDWEYLKAFELGAMFGDFDIDARHGDFPVWNREETWDRSDYTLFLHLKMCKHLKWKLEYTSETADGPIEDAQLDYFHALLQIKF